MIDKQVLIDMGFLRDDSWEGEVYYHESDFWVHFGGRFDESRWNISGNVSMKEFFKRFLDNFEKEIESRWIR